MRKTPYSIHSGRLFQMLTIPTLLSFVFACFNNSASTSANINQDYELVLEQREGTLPQHTSGVPHQQLDQNSSDDALYKLKTFLFALDHVTEKGSKSSFPSARGAYIEDKIRINRNINREFTHIHMIPGPGSQHLTLKEQDAIMVIENGWGIKHPWSDRMSADGYMLMMIFAPRHDTDLDNIKKIITAAWHLVLEDR